MGEIRAEERVILESDPRSADLVRALLGGELATQRTLAASSSRGGVYKGGPSEGPFSSGGRGRREANTAGAAEQPNAGRDAASRWPSDKAGRMEQIVSLWRRLVGGQKHPRSGGPPGTDQV
jgi:hypothetical protein